MAPETPKIDETAVCRNCNELIVYRPYVTKGKTTEPVWWHIVSMRISCEINPNPLARLTIAAPPNKED